MFLKGAQNRNKDCDLSLEFLKTLWEKQKGICPITGWQLVLPHHSAKRLNKRNMYAASLDRIDCSQGYLKSNVRFVAYIANIARNVFSEQELLTFCKAVVAK
jgi:hypothetical protein